MKKKLLSPTELKQLHAQQEEQKKILATQKLEEEKNKKLVSPKELLDPVVEPVPIVESVEVSEVPKDPIEVLRERIEEVQYSIPEPKDYDEEIAYLEAILSTKLNSSDLNLEPIQNRLYELKEEILNLPEVKYYDDEISALQEQLNSIVIPEVRYYDEEISSLQQEINAIEIPEVKYYDKDVRDIHERLDLIKLSEDNTFQKHESILNELKTLTKELTNNLEQLYIPEEFDASELENHISTLQENVVEIKNELSSLPEVKYYENELTELSQMIENVRNSIPSIPEIKYYDTELQDLSSLIEEVRKNIPELPEVRYYENEISVLEQKILDVENQIPELPELPEVKYYDKEITQLEDNVVSVKKSISELKKLVDGIEIPVPTDWSSDIQSIYREIEKLKEVPVLEESTDPLVPLDQKFATLDDLQNHYRLFINRIQQQLASLGGGGETRLEFLDDIDRTSAKTDGYVLSYQASTGKFIGVPMSGGGGGGGSGISTYADVAGIATYATSAGVSTYASIAGIATYSSTSGIATYATTAGVATYSSVSGISTYSGIAGIATYATTAGIATYSGISGIATYASNAGVATYSTFSGIATYSSNAGVATYSGIAGVSTYSATAGIATYASTAGIATVSQGLTGTPSISVSSLTASNASFSGIVTASNSAVIKTGTATTALIVEGDARVIGILTIGTSSITLDGTINQVNVGTGVTLHHTNGVQVGGNTLHTTGLTLNHINVSGISTISQLDITNGINVSGVISATEFIGNFSGNSSTASYATNSGIATYASSAGVSTYSSTSGIATYSTAAGIATYASTAGISTYSTTAGVATYSPVSGVSTYSNTAGIATYSSVSGIATYAINAGISTYASSAGIATYSSTSGIATYATNAGISTYASTSGVSTYSETSGISTYASTAGVSTYASNAGVATYSSVSGIATYSTSSGIATYASSAGISTYAQTAGIATSAGAATTATYLADAANIITGTINKDRISTTNALTILGDLYVSNNISFGGTATQLNTQQLQISDADIVLGIGTSFSPTDNTANHGGVAVASTEGTPLVDLNIVPGETNPSTYKKIMWFRGDTIGTGLTDAWLFNYGVGIGSTQVPNGVRLAAGAVQFTQNDLAVVRNVNASGIVTASNSAVIKAGTATTALIVEGNTRIVGILTIGNSSITLDGDINQVNVGSGVTLHHTNGVQVGGNTLHTSGLTLNHVNLSGITTLGTVKIASGIVTATSGVVTYYGDGQYLQNILSGVGVATAGGLVGTGATILDFRGAGISTVTVSAGIATINIVGGGGGGAVSIGTQAPPSPTNGDLWYSPDYGRTFVWYDEVALGIGSTSVWVDAAPFNNFKEEELTSGKATNSFTATGNQSLFPVSYTVGYIDVYLNGIRLSDTEFVATNGSSITLTQPASSGDIIDVVQYTLGIGATGPQGPQGPLSQVVGITSSIVHYPLIVSGVGSVTASVTTTSNYFSFTPSSGTLSVNQLSVVGVATATDFNSTSDINLKENVKIIDNAVDKVNSISGITFNWKETKKPSAGVIAQEVEKVLPEIVHENDGNKTLNYNGLIGLLIEAVKEQQEEINNLKTRLERLEG